MQFYADAAKIKRWREERHWSQEHLADLAGIGLRTIQRVEQGEKASGETLKALAAECRAILGPDVSLSYAADWTEYGAYAPADGSGDVDFPLDELWADPDIDFVGKACRIVGKS